MNKPLLTAENAFNGGRNNKLLNPQADFLSLKINDLQNGKSRRRAAFSLL
ncbi:hypothetical protein GTP46_07075 [Duganella sp. FT135W]|uniref:Uncharacterized protein n=1 Tax=Duganella flavida TaxID=2692175 RepID=A0A6L8K916_9BURK|nr:hypothetical protein [Duganella flavida]MYM22402.1 hypothetical protein [Duganella flavida]